MYFLNKTLTGQTRVRTFQVPFGGIKLVLQVQERQEYSPKSIYPGARRTVEYVWRDATVMDLSVTPVTLPSPPVVV